ncbi:MAG: iron-sulfur cluster assembly accessory protein [Chloroflexi bacterium]|nr:iron-sulfur cluster assembly accessory protein [Chloroflexota bacterium]
MSLTITISSKAAEKVRLFGEKEGLDPSNSGIRVAVKGGGCAGLMYTLSMEKEPRPDDKVLEESGVRLFVDKRSYVFLAGTTLDYTDGLNGKGFVFHNPQAKSTCGCGNSFAV